MATKLSVLVLASSEVAGEDVVPSDPPHAAEKKMEGHCTALGPVHCL